MTRTLSLAPADLWMPFAVAAIAFAVDLVTPRAIVDFYLFAVLVCLRARSTRAPLYVAALCTPLMIVGYSIAPTMGSPPIVTIINRVSSILIVWFCALMIARMLKSNMAAREAQDRAQSTERRFRVMADGVPAMIWVTNAQGEIEFVNREYCRFFGMTLEQVQAQGWQPLIHPEDAASYTRDYAAALAARTPFHARARVRGASGGWHWVESSGVPRYSETGAFLGHVGLSPDITAMVETQEALKAADRRKDEFLAVLSHELRNPLTPIRNAAEILAAPGVGPEQIQWARSVISRQSGRMAGLLDDLLDLARIAEGKLELRKRRVSLSSVTDPAVEAVRPILERKSHRLLVNLPVDAPTLEVDPLRLSQVLSNLLTNAAKYTDPGGQIELVGRVEQGTLSLSVKDNGIGISPEAAGRIFTMFSQLDSLSSRAEGGIGIGLALVKGLVELQGGTIEARSEGRGCGSEFIVRLPLGATALSAMPVREREAPAVATRGRRVLIADDNRDAADSLAILLTLAGHEVRVAHDGLTALSLAQAFRPRAAVLDIGMPGLDGYAVAQALRRESWGADIFLIALTGWGQEEDKRRAAIAGFDTHLTKPAQADRIKSLLSDPG